MIARRDVVTSTIEHPATEACCAFLEGEGHKVTRVPAKADGLIDHARVAAAIDGKTALVTIIHAQNEIGTIQPIAEIAAAARRHGALVHVDAAQSVGKIAVNVNELGADLLSIAGHKLYAPKGVGVLYIRHGIALPPLLLGAGQERGRRPGTENVPYIVALGEACRIAGAMLEREARRLSGLSGDLFAALKREIPEIVLVGDPKRRLPNTLNVLFPRTSGRKVLEKCRRVMASTGSACHADSEEPSAILDGARHCARQRTRRGAPVARPRHDKRRCGGCCGRSRRGMAIRVGGVRGCGGMRTSALMLQTEIIAGRQS